MSGMKVAILGASGMLGSMILDVLARNERLSLIATVRNEKLASKGQAHFEDAEWKVLNAEEADILELQSVIGDAKWVINAIGITKPYIHDDDPNEIERALKVNSLFPFKLGRAAMNKGRVLQIATDCVYSGKRGQYSENDLHDPLDVYGKTKSLGETFLPNVHHLRCSIIGPEPKTYAFLLEWFRRQHKDAKVQGYRNHNWNGITTLHFALICQTIIEKNLEMPHLQHILPTGVVSKAELLEIFSEKFNRKDIVITPTDAKVITDRTLATMNNKLNQELWNAAGYAEPPSISMMVAESVKHNFHITF